MHPGLHRELDYDNYRVEPHRYYSIQHAPLRAVAAGSTDRRYDPSKTDVPEAVVLPVTPVAPPKSRKPPVAKVASKR